MLRVVIIEDARNIRVRLVQLVEDIGSMQVVGEADTEESAVAVCRSSAPDAIILDLKLATGTGLGVLKTMRYAGAEKKPAIIVLTNFALPAFDRAARALGADWILDKSSEFHKLRGLLQGLLAVPDKG
jgi:DNA-binding NarL/FixJ family response regulator